MNFDCINALVALVSQGNSPVEELIYHFKNKSELASIVSSNLHKATVHFNQALATLTDAEKVAFVEGVVNYILNLTRASNARGESQFLFYASSNGRTRERGGTGCFHPIMYLHRDTLVLLLTGASGTLSKVKPVISKCISSKVLREVHVRKGRDPWLEDSIRKHRKINQSFFSPSTEYIDVEQHCSLILGDSMFGNAVPYFSQELLKLLSMFLPYSIEVAGDSRDFFKQEIANHLHYCNTQAFTLSLDYRSTPTALSFDPEIEKIESSGHDTPGKWSISSSLGKCSYEFNPTKQSSRVEITLFMTAIATAAKRCRVDPYVLMVVVYVHELAHYTYFTGQFSLGTPFYPVKDRDFDIGQFGTTEFHEAMAQYVTYLVVREDSLLFNTFKKLNRRQSKAYQLWRSMRPIDGWEFGRRLAMSNLNEVPRDISLLLPTRED